MTPIADILAAATPVEGGFRATIPSGWLQGRTAYGGLSSALALHAAQGSDADLPPLRSAQISFIGPLSGEVTVTATRLRRGRNAAFVQADIVSEAGLGFRATFVFMADQQSRIALDEQPPAGHAHPRRMRSCASDHPISSRTISNSSTSSTTRPARRSGSAGAGFALAMGWTRWSS